MNDDDRSPIAQAVGTASQITTIGLTMILPAFAGYYLDRWLGTVLLFVILGLGLGVASAVLQMSRLIHQLNRESQPDSNKSAGGSHRD